MSHRVVAWALAAYWLASASGAPVACPPDASLPCRNGGECLVDSVVGTYCRCAAGLVGRFCEVRANAVQTPCTGAGLLVGYCTNGGICPTTAPAYCDCTAADTDGVNTWRCVGRRRGARRRRGDVLSVTQIPDLTATAPSTAELTASTRPSSAPAHRCGASTAATVPSDVVAPPPVPALLIGLAAPARSSCQLPLSQSSRPSRAQWLCPLGWLLPSSSGWC